MTEAERNPKTQLEDMLFLCAAEIRNINRQNGWYDVARDFPTDIALLHSEVSELFEAWRKDQLGHMAEEAADVFIRLIDTCDRSGINLATAYFEKCRKNRTRSYRHGGKRV